MTQSFPPAPRGKKGYDRAQVDAFLAEARAAFERAEGAAELTAESIRCATFSLKRKGYATPYVDAALERLEDVFAERAKAEWIAEQGESEWIESARQTAQEIVNRLARPKGKRFTHAGWVTLGYRMSEVDAFSDKLMRYFTEGLALTPADVRTVVFSAQRGGYREEQVDALLDAVVEVMLAVR